jgi:DNA-directed RNA polymerase subunit RPC12/RpoP
MDHRFVVLPPAARFIILGIILLAWLALRVIPMLVKREHVHLNAGTPREYGLGGGAICGRCHRPFALVLFGLKLGLGYKFVRCPHCGHWGVVKRRSLEELRAAEADELVDAQLLPAGPEKSEEQKLREQINNSRYTGPM